ncbi:atrial natriuretic peptide receptor 1-like [Paramacrobiotus metropolitanus]|uniref:atrial natriuretic peptide receptor 1-like n=1 Tax=Paramacrobiotus metropolitanus TaxID=2943436 RepID=UPI002445D411|nr:atrial natriuretic peptide receptor 1-like [Paramacrobiotus metropolitanus]
MCSSIKFYCFPSVFLIQFTALLFFGVFEKVDSRKTSELHLQSNYSSEAYEARTDIHQLRACLFIERDLAGHTYYGYEKAAAAMDFALEYANELIMPQKVKLSMQHIDIGTECRERNHLAAMMLNMIDTGYICDVIIGPGCGYGAESLYDVTDFYKIPMIGCPAASVGTQGPIEEYAYITRISFTHINTAHILLRFFREHNYTSIMFLQDQTVMMFKHLSIVIRTVFANEEFDIYTRSDWKQINNSDWSDARVQEYLKSAAPRSRVFVFITHSKVVRRFLIMAQKLGLTSGDYLFIAVELWQNVYWGDYSNYNGTDHDGNNAIARKAYRTLLLITLHNRNDREYANFARRVKEESAKKGYYNYSEHEEVDVLVSHFYDSIIYYASLVANLVNAGKDYTNADQMFNLILHNYSFVSPINGHVFLDDNGDRTSEYVIRNFDYDQGKFEDLWHYPAGNAVPSNQLGILNWPKGRTLPPNRPRCGYLGEDPKCAAEKITPGQIAAAVVVPLIVLTACVIIATILLQRIYASTIDPFWWRIFVSELSFTTATSRTQTSASVFQSTVSKSKLSGLNDSKGEDGKPGRRGPDPLAYRQEAIFGGNTVELRQLEKPLLKGSPGLRPYFDAIKRLDHRNLQKFIAIAVNDEQLCEYFVGETCSKGSLNQLLDNAKFNLDWNFKNSLIKDMASGMTYLHASAIQSHGNLNAHTCRIDSSFVLKIADYGMGIMRNAEDLRPVSEVDLERDFDMLLWRAPELLRVRMPPEGTQKGDVYSFAIVLQQVILRSPPYRNNNIPKTGGDDFSSRDIIMEVKRGSNPPLRPRVPNSSCPTALLDILERCWDEMPSVRPTFQRLRENFAQLFGHSGDSIVEHLIHMMEKEAASLEQEAEEKMHLMLEEKRRSDEILSQILPKTIAQALTQGKQILPETYASTTVHFSDIEGFPELILQAETPADTVYILNTLYATCDAVIEKFDVYKVETVKDAYLVVSGLPVRNGIKHAGEIATMALYLKRDIGFLTFRNSTASTPKLRLRVGLHSGSCVAAIIGTKMPRYCLFGDTVNTSSRMESHGEPGKIQCSENTKELLDKIGGFVVLPRGEINVKGKGPMNTYWVIAKD